MRKCSCAIQTGFPCKFKNWQPLATYVFEQSCLQTTSCFDHWIAYATRRLGDTITISQMECQLMSIGISLPKGPSLASECSFPQHLEKKRQTLGTYSLQDCFVVKRLDTDRHDRQTKAVTEIQILNLLQWFCMQKPCLHVSRSPIWRAETRLCQ